MFRGTHDPTSQACSHAFATFTLSQFSQGRETPAGTQYPCRVLWAESPVFLFPKRMVVK